MSMRSGEVNLEGKAERAARRDVVRVLAGNRVREFREGLGMSRQELSHRSTCAYSTVRHLEEGWMGVSPDTAGRIAAALGQPRNVVFPWLISSDDLDGYVRLPLGVGMRDV